MSTLYAIVYVQVYSECMYKSIDGLMISNSVEVELQCVRKSVNCVQRVNSLIMRVYICAYRSITLAHT